MSTNSQTQALLYLVATLKAAKGSEDKLLSALKALVPLSRQESGCVRYDLHVDREDPSVLIVYEIWRDDEALDDHASSAHFQHFLKIAEPLLSAPLEVRILDLVV
ncbi:putative quinol monooxygenase [Pseudomonas sp. LS-2]|jgi:quinol monooxygenase YgiN|uniref:putative quinol monooxygenase n=1 Tax=Pseudomonas sp. LS-2 TaxID=2315859 RepID=UPI000E71A751|nr:putative quinol monooxygenase [Pseudomonas sp. LS-2]RJX83380.1 antibiotic biosynthesis monooxygenase [Pseudomonas sp. LS-2]